jgi:hypothetical protein
LGDGICMDEAMISVSTLQQGNGRTELGIARQFNVSCDPHPPSPIPYPL